MDQRLNSGRGSITTFGGLSRSELMSRIRSRRNATTELKLINLFRAQHITGWQRGSSLKGKPDFVFRKARCAVFVDGCFWHGHDCARNNSPQQNAIFWQLKIARNRLRDRCVANYLRHKGWSVIRVWECRLRRHPESVVLRVQRYIEQSAQRRPIA